MTDRDSVERSAQQCREVVREAHEAIKDLRAAMAEQRESVRTQFAELARAELDAQVARQLKLLENTTQRAMAAAVAKVTGEFDRLAGIFLGTEDGGPSLEQLVRHHTAVRERRSQAADR